MDPYHTITIHKLRSNYIIPDSLSSQPVRVCICTSEGSPDCDLGLPHVSVKKGEALRVSLVAVDQANHSIPANIISSLASSYGGFGEGQQTQAVKSNCTEQI